MQILKGSTPSKALLLVKVQLVMVTISKAYIAPPLFARFPMNEEFEILTLTSLGLSKMNDVSSTTHTNREQARLVAWSSTHGQRTTVSSGTAVQKLTILYRECFLQYVMEIMQNLISRWIPFDYLQQRGIRHHRLKHRS